MSLRVLARVPKNDGHQMGSCNRAAAPLMTEASPEKLRTFLFSTSIWAWQEQNIGICLQLREQRKSSALDD